MIKEIIEKIKLKCMFDHMIALTTSINSKDFLNVTCVINTSMNIQYDGEEYHVIKQKIKSAAGQILLISEKAYLPIANRLLWECSNINGVLYIDMDNPYEIEESVTSKDKLLWDIQANLSKDNNQAFMSGWINSYNYNLFTPDELFEYVENTRLKLLPYLNKDKLALEVGIGSGMIACALSPLLKSYDGCDISEFVLRKLDEIKLSKNINNISLYNCAADQIESINKKYDLILMSSVTEYFSGYNYMRSAIEKGIHCMNDTGQLFLGDIFDLNLKEQYMESVFSYSKEHPECRSKKDFSHELYIPRGFWEDIANSFSEIESVCISNKIGNIQNEINQFRYDVLFVINKNSINKGTEKKIYKHQFGINV